MARGWIKAIAETPALRDRITIVGLNDINADAARRLALEFGLNRAAVETDLEALLKGTRPGPAVRRGHPRRATRRGRCGAQPRLPRIVQKADGDEPRRLKHSRGGDFVNLAANYEGGDPSLRRAS
jgi:hypothetical protein